MALKQLVALTAITRMKKPGKPGDASKGISPTAPVTEDIKAGTVFKAVDADQEDEFLNKLKCASVFNAKDDSTRVSPGATGAEPTKENDDGLDGLRAEYEEVVGKKPAANAKEETMRKHIKKAEDEAAKKAADDGENLV